MRMSTRKVACERSAESPSTMRVSRVSCGAMLSGTEMSRMKV